MPNLGFKIEFINDLFDVGAVAAQVFFQLIASFSSLVKLS
jgi:hypothetical protein